MLSKILSILVFFVLLTALLNGQKVINVSFEEIGNIHLAEGISIPKIESGYTLWIPNSNEIKGMIVFFHSRRDTIKQDFIIQYSNKNQLAVMYVTTFNRLEFFFDEKRMEETASYIANVCNSLNIPKDKLLFTGMSLAGTRALKMHIFIRQNNAYMNIEPKAIAVCDSPIDMSRFYHSCVKAMEMNCEPLSANEGKWVSGYLHANLRGKPIESVARYNQYSPYSRTVRNGGNAAYFKNIHLRAYTEPDLEWWKENRCKSYKDINAYDLEAFVHQLDLFGNENAQLMITENKGYQPDGSRHPHSWSIVDEKDLISWFLNIIDE